MQPERQAVIDVGTNSVKLLVADVQPPIITPLFEKSWQTRLGRGLYATHRLHPEAIAETAKAVFEFAELARQAGAEQVLAIATSAARDAVNREALVSVVRDASGLELRVISGEQEAEWVYRGVTAALPQIDDQLLILDIGGGSSEFIWRASAEHVCRQSFKLGAVRLLEQLRPGDPPGMNELIRCREWLEQFFANHIAVPFDTSLIPGTVSGATLVATGGTATILARMKHRSATSDRQLLDGTRLTISEIQSWVERLWHLSLTERQSLPGLPPNRADVILTGAAIYEAVLAHFRFGEISICTRGLRFGALLEGPR